MSRNLLSRSHEALGLDQKFWLSIESGGYGEDATSGLLPIGSDAVEHINGNIKFDIPRSDSEARSGRSVVTRHSGKKEVEISYEGYVIPGTPDGSGNPTLPPLHAMFLSVFGSVDLTDPAEIVYKLTSLNNNSFRMLEETSHFTKLAIGCVADSMTFQLPGDGKSMVSMEGFGQDAFFAGQSVLAQALTSASVAASKIVQDLTYTADAVGSNGNLITITYTGGATAGAEVVSLTGTAISVQIETAVTTASQIKTAVDAHVGASALVSVAVSGVGGNAQVVAAAVNLAGGLLDTEAKVGSGQGQMFEADGYIDVIDKDDGNTVKSSAKKVVAIGTGVNADIVRVSVAFAAADVNDIVIGHAPVSYDPIDSSNALLGLKGSVSFASGGQAEAISAEVAIANNFTKKDFLYGTSKNKGYLPDKRRTVTLKCEVLLNKDNFVHFMRSKQFIAEDVTLTLEPQDIPAPSYTSGVGRTFEWKMPKVEFNIPEIEQPGDSYVSLALEGTCMATSKNALDTEITLTIR